MESRIELGRDETYEMVKCRYAMRYRLKSVYCQRKDQWLALNYCLYMCIEREL